MSKRLTWMREPRETGLAGVASAGRRRGWHLNYGKDNRVASVAESGGRWYWYGSDESLGVKGPRNTLAEGKTFATDEEAKADCMRVFQEGMKGVGK